ncbi:aldo/keto reductase [Novosphingobium sp. ZN18A2]|uniref:aldo/keto reductase n=1 Tax=Novosphingobium sp. ZN18A2 TaxID=3079861 RepID=UPI0030D50F07
MRAGVLVPQPVIILNDGREMPQFGFGTWQVPDSDAAECVRDAVDIGYKLVDTAAIYENEDGVGEGLRGRNQVWLTTKVWNRDQGHEGTRAALDRSLERLGRDNVDLLLLHWPCPEQDLYVESWKAMIELRDEGKALSIGVSNFLPEHLERLDKETGVVPAVNQVELHPTFQQRELRKVHADMGIATQSWSPLGQGKAMNNPVIREIAEETGATPAAVVLRWHLQNGLAPIPKASSHAHAADNFAALSTHLKRDQMGRIEMLDDANGRIGPDPATFSGL